MKRLPRNLVKSDPFGLLSEYPCIIKCPIHWSDQDPFGHLNNVEFLRYFESSRLAYFNAFTSYEKHLTEDRVGPIIFKLSCDFLGQVTFPDMLYIGTKIPLNQIRDRSYGMHHCIVSSNEEKIVAQGSAVVVTYDYAKQQKTKHPQEYLDSINRTENGDIAFEDWADEL